MDLSYSSAASFETETEAFISSRMNSGNLALCQTNGSTRSIECLGWHVGDQFKTIMRPRGEITDGEGNILNWRFEDGFLRAIGSDGQATDRCLGPEMGVTTLDGNTSEPYELVVQDCPDSDVHDRENIFVHNAVASRTTKSSPHHTTTPTELTRHMKFLVVGNGHVQSLAPVFDSKHPGEDIVNEKPFCMTAMKWDGDQHTKAYLIPCRESGVDGEDTVDTKSDKLEERVSLQQQLFDIDNRSSYESYLFELDSRDQRFLQLAYQIGHNGNSAANTEAKNYDSFDSYMIRVMTAGDSSLDQDPKFVFERSVSPGPDSKSGILYYPFSYFGTAGSMEAHLIGTSRYGLESTWLASTPFVVSERDIKPLTNGVTWALVTFSAFMACYFLLLKAIRCSCDVWKRKRKRESEITADTVNMIANGYPIFADGNNYGTRNNIRLPSVIEALNVDLPNRITEEDEFDMDSEGDENDNSGYLTEAETSVGSSELFTITEAGATVGSNDSSIDFTISDIETAEQPDRKERS